ncbi:MAG: UDP-N-acetyl glucosamine 2-epimerase, partial [Pseudomonadales bacterium]|nr:UDP-N-acetyl glucosamine 2-epimerase [Pseudomonadales bacterium]
MHRPSNVDDEKTLGSLISTIAQASQQIPIIFPVHPRTQSRIEQYGLNSLITEANIVTTGPLGYMELLGLMSKAKLVLTDSGGIQEETTALGVPCITLRENTERPITVEQGTNTVVGADSDLILKTLAEVLTKGGKKGRQPEFWDGQAAVRIAKDLEKWFKELSPSV